MSDTRLHDELVEQYGDEYTATEARYESLKNATYNTIRSAAARLDLHRRGDDEQELRQKLAEAGVFHGGVGDENLYQYDDDSVEKLVAPA